jgi:hypothetical protein
MQDGGDFGRPFSVGSYNDKVIVDRRQSTIGRRALCLGLLPMLAGLLLWMAVWVPHAEAVPKAKLGSCGTPNGSQGGQLIFAKGVAANLGTGDIYVAEANANHRITQFSADCEFIRTWGYDVIALGAPTDKGTGFEVCQEASQCKAGIAGTGAGQLNNPQGIAIDQSTGYLYVTSIGNRRVDVFSPTGEFAGAFGYDVLPGDLNPSGPDFCTAATGCQAAAAAGPAAGRFSNLTGTTPAAAGGKVYVPDVGNLRVAEYTTTLAGNVLTSATFERAFGWGVDTGAAQLESCTILSECQAGTSGNGLGQFTSGGSPTAVAVDSTGSIYVTSGPLTSGTCSSATPCRVYKFAPSGTSAETWGPVAGEGQLTFTAGKATDVAALNVAVDPATDHVFVLRKLTGTTYKVFEYNSTGEYLEAHPAGSALSTSGNTTATTSTGLAVGTQGRVYINYGAGNLGEIFILGPIPPPEVEVTAAEDVTATSARFEGVVEVPEPGGPGFEATYHFEYSSDGVNWISLPGGTTGSAAEEYEVSATVEDLEPNTQYSVRLVATTGETVSSAPVPFKTSAAPPRIDLTFTEEVTQTGAELMAHIDPQGSKTTYHFEWATQEEWAASEQYGHRLPALDRTLGGGNEVLIAGLALNGLEPASTYHFRVVATSSDGIAEGPDQVFETLNSCGLTDGRCFGLVSPADKGPVGAPGDGIALGKELKYQVSPAGESIAYAVAYGFPGSTSGGEIMHRSIFAAGGWATEQLAPPALVVPEGEGSQVARTQALALDLGCGAITTTQPLQGAPEGPLNAGLSNLVKLNSDDTWTVISNLEPSGIPANTTLFGEYDVIGMSPDCGRVVFRSKFQYPGVEGAGEHRLYQWDEGELSGIGVIPGSGGAVVESVPGAPENPNQKSLGDAVRSANYWNAVSDDARRVYFTSISKEGGDAGQQALFLSEDGGLAVDVSQSQTGTPNNDSSVFQTASTDGSQVFFLGRQGLAPDSEEVKAGSCGQDGTGCALYRYSVDGGSLTELSSAEPDAENPQGAGAVGVLAADEDGSHVYFAARGQLIPKRGSTEQQNHSADTYNVYLSQAGGLEYVGRIKEESSSSALIHTSQALAIAWSSRTTPDGSHLLFESRANVTGYDSEGKREAYLYSVDNNFTACVSCRRDGLPSVASSFLDKPLPEGVSATDPDSPPQIISEDGSRIFFISPNRLASGATEGKEALYQWENGQISFIADSVPGSGFSLQFAGSSESGDNVFFTTLDQLTWQDQDGQLDVYVARPGGGIPQPPAPPAPCDPLSEGSCGGTSSGATPSVLPPASSTFTGPGNPPASEKPKRKAKKKGKKKKGKGRRGGKRTSKGKRGTSSTGRTK